MSNDEYIELLQGIMYAYCDECNATHKEQCDMCKTLEAYNKANALLKKEIQDDRKRS